MNRKQRRMKAKSDRAEAGGRTIWLSTPEQEVKISKLKVDGKSLKNGSTISIGSNNSN